MQGFAISQTEWLHQECFLLPGSSRRGHSCSFNSIYPDPFALVVESRLNWLWAPLGCCLDYLVFALRGKVRISQLASMEQNRHQVLLLQKALIADSVHSSELSSRHPSRGALSRLTSPGATHFVCMTHSLTAAIASYAASRGALCICSETTQMYTRCQKSILNYCFNVLRWC